MKFSKDVRAFDDRGGKKEGRGRCFFSWRREESMDGIEIFLRHSDSQSMAGVKLNFPLWKVFN